MIRRATPDDVDFLVELLNNDEVEPFLDSVIHSVGLIKRELYGEAA